MGKFFGEKPKVNMADIFTPQQLSFLNKFIEQGGQGLLAGDNIDGQNREQFAMNQWRQNVAPSIMERFRGIGGGQGQNMASSGLGQMFLGSGQDLAAKMADQKYDRNWNRNLQLSQLGLAQQTQPVVTPGTQGIAGSFSEGLGKALPMMFGL